MDTSKILQDLDQQLSDSGFKSILVSVQHLSLLKSDLESLLELGLLDRSFYDEIIPRYDLYWQYEPPANFPDVKSIVLVAKKQPKTNIQFTLSGKTVNTIHPPTYIHDVDEEASKLLTQSLGKYGYKVMDAVLPEKLLAVHSGLAKYGRNNIAYIEGWGSYFRLKSFFTDLPVASDNFQEVKMMDQCSNCVACLKNCPTGAIQENRIVIQAEKCLTYFNEGAEDFPRWIDPKSHNCIIGCMDCQDVCPVDNEFKNWIVDGETFSEEETHKILTGVPREDLPIEMTEKLKKMYLLHDYSLLQRNLRVLLDKESF